MKANEILNEDWQKVNKKDKTDGMSSKAVKAYRRENPGSKLKTAVTTKPSKLKKGSKSAKRRKSFCARMSGMKKAHASAKTKRDPDSPINKALRRWNCESIEQSIEQLEQQLTEAKKTLKNSNPCWKGYKPVGTKKKGGRTVPNCVPKESVEESKERCMQCGMTDCTCPPGKCKCKPVAGWEPGKGFKKAMDEAANAAQQAAIAVSMKKAGKTPKKKVNEFAPAGSGNSNPPRDPKNPIRDPWDGNDDGEDPYGRPDPRHYRRSIDFFGKFEADHFDEEVFDKETGVFKGYWYDKEAKDGKIQIAYFKFDDPRQAAKDFDDSPGMGWYYEPQNESMMEVKTKKQEAPKPRNFVAKNATTSGAGAHKDKKKAEKQGDVKHKGKMLDLAEMEDILEKASRALCTSSTPDKDLGASNLASCKSQGLRARDGEKSHLITAGKRKVRIKVGGKRIKGKKYGGPLPDYGTRK